MTEKRKKGPRLEDDVQIIATGHIEGKRSFTRDVGGVGQRRRTHVVVSWSPETGDAGYLPGGDAKNIGDLRDLPTATIDQVPYLGSGFGRARRGSSAQTGDYAGRRRENPDEQIHKKGGFVSAEEERRVAEIREKKDESKNQPEPPPWDGA